MFNKIKFHDFPKTFNEFTEFHMTFPGRERRILKFHEPCETCLPSGLRKEGQTEM